MAGSNTDVILRTALAASGIVLWEADLVTQKLSLDSNWPQLAGAGPRRITLPIRALSRFLFPEVVVSLKQQLEAVRGNREDHIQIQHRIRHRNGTWIWIESHGRVAERDKSGNPLHLI